ncbi:hypothetical protein F4775DRAFT_185576 [Biscogniauxia sp. FL1348]|nr:hypothetical protein F4775DRAFT_185576 [Biscogniauxia sp. FL1348]
MSDRDTLGDAYKLDEGREGLHTAGLETEDGVCRVFILLAYLRAEGSVTPNEEIRISPLERSRTCISYRDVVANMLPQVLACARGGRYLQYPNPPFTRLRTCVRQRIAPNKPPQIDHKLPSFFLFVQILPCPFSILAFSFFRCLIFRLCCNLIATMPAIWWWAPETHKRKKS